MDGRRRAGLKLAALLHDIDGPLNRHGAHEGRRDGFAEHVSTSTRTVADLGHRLRLSRHEVAYTVKTVRHHRSPLVLFEAGIKKNLTQRNMTRFFMKTHPFTADICLLCLAGRQIKSIAPATGPAFEPFIRNLIHRYESDFRPSLETPALISGHDLIHHLHLSPSPRFKFILARTRAYQLAGEITTREEALNFAAGVIVPSTP